MRNCSKVDRLTEGSIGIYSIAFQLRRFKKLLYYRNDPKFSDRYTWANSADPDQTAPLQGLHCKPFCLHSLDSLLYGGAT